MTLNLLAEGPITEFITVDGIFYNGTCGQCALEVAKAAIKGLHSNQLDMVAMAHDMNSHGEGGATGASDMGEVAWEAQRQGLTILHVTDYQQPLSENWHQELLDNAGINPVILEFANAGVLTDVTNGAHDERSVQYHYIVILNKQAAGYIVNDGDNSEAATAFPVYSYANLAQAVPCAIMVLKGPIMPNIPSGWSDSASGDINNPNGILSSPGGHTVQHAFRAYVLTHEWTASNIAISGEYSTGAHSLQNFVTCRLIWDGTSVSVLPPAPPDPTTPAPIATDPAIVAALEAAQAQINLALSKVVK